MENKVNGGGLGCTNGVKHEDGPSKKRLRPEPSNGHGVEGGRWVVRSSTQAHACVNPVRSCEEKYFKEAMERRDKSKKLIKLSIGELWHWADLLVVCVAMQAVGLWLYAPWLWLIHGQFWSLIMAVSPNS